MPYVPTTMIARGFGRIMAQHGEPMVLSREGEASTVTLTGKRISTAVNPENNTAVQQGVRVKVGVAELASSSWTSKAPQRLDTLTIDGRARKVLDVRQVKDGAAIALYDLDVSG